MESRSNIGWEAFESVLYGQHRASKAQADLERCKASTPEALAAALPLVREIFTMFDADADSRLNKAEYKAYLQRIGGWPKNYTDEQWDERWPKLCAFFECEVEGVTAEAFEEVYSVHDRVGQARADFDKCATSVSTAGFGSA